MTCTIQNNELGNHPAIANFLEHVDIMSAKKEYLTYFYSFVVDKFLAKENAVWTEDGLIFESEQDFMVFLLRWS